jgi:hypothetical protein
VVLLELAGPLAEVLVVAELSGFGLLSIIKETIAAIITTTTREMR